MSGEVESSPELEGIELSQSMALIPYAPAHPPWHEAHPYLEDPAALTSGNIYSVDIDPWVSTSDFMTQFPAMDTPSFPAAPAYDPLLEEAVVPFNTFDDNVQQIYTAYDQQISQGYLAASVMLAHFSDNQHQHHHELVPPDGLDHHHVRTSSDAAAFVDTLKEVDLASIDPEDMTCPLCWLPFGNTTEEDDPSILAYLNEEDKEITARLNASYEMPFCTNRPNNDPVKTPCGHVFGKQCLMQSLEETNRMCPLCRQRLIDSTDGSSEYDGMPALIPGSPEESFEVEYFDYEWVS
jgi:hypothetical protein